MTRPWYRLNCVCVHIDPYLDLESIVKQWLYGCHRFPCILSTFRTMVISSSLSLDGCPWFLGDVRCLFVVIEPGGSCPGFHWIGAQHQRYMNLERRLMSFNSSHGKLMSSGQLHRCVVSVSLSADNCSESIWLLVVPSKCPRDQIMSEMTHRMSYMPTFPGHQLCILSLLGAGWVQGSEPAHCRDILWEFFISIVVRWLNPGGYNQ